VLRVKGSKLKRWFDFALRWTVAEAAARYSRTNGRVVQLELCGATTYATTHADIIKHVMCLRPSNYLLRPGEPWGLAEIGMLSQGVIWNRDLEGFRHGRAAFTKALRELRRGTEVACRVAEAWCASFGGEWREVDMMDAMGELTVKVALPLFFGVDGEAVDPSEVRELRDAIKGYFEAWEFFLVKPSWYRHWDRVRASCGGTSRCEVARSKVERVRRAVDVLLERTVPEQGAGSVFLDLIKGLEWADQRQMCIELLLASADTSSVTLYYTLLLLAARPDLAEDLRAEAAAACARGPATEAVYESGLPLMTACLRESMRLKPVGPMVLRTAVDGDEVRLDGKTLPVAAGTHFLLNIRDYHVDPDYFPNPLQDDLKRYHDPRQEELFMPFGKGPKSCVGQFFAMREMKVILAQVLQQLEFHTDDKLESIETRWDIANHPISPSPFSVRRRRVALGLEASESKASVNGGLK